MRLMSSNSDKPHTNSRNREIRIAPSTRLKAILPCSDGQYFVRLHVAPAGRNLYIKMKKAMEKIMLPIMAHPPISTFFPPSSSAIDSRPALRENLEATKPSRIACPSVARPRMNGQPSHLRRSDGRCNGSECVAISPDFLRM